MDAVATLGRTLGFSLAAGVNLVVRHLLPVSYGFLAVQITLLVPSFILAEATLSFVGLGFR